MVCRIAVHEQRDSISSDDNARAKQFRDWMKQQPGFEAAYHVQDPVTGKTVSISFWHSMEAMMALKDRTPPGGPVGLKPVSVEIFPVVEKF
jgi:heme-degrading monooxygenase HmoA